MQKKKWFLSWYEHNFLSLAIYLYQESETAATAHVYARCDKESRRLSRLYVISNADCLFNLL